ncbi:alpha/beta hydrolase [Paludisphaera mucosa]|uniref:Alpha/beta fold hydrolase n=1 Tax=Paludisphaera mucosa TaxID=3030827 RepID=A0ABT6F411_9BACT|nr:alpha/beta fold hydrolase [Paludisphaera mucosa]MDG3002328.1 alpha/beta fold hydrolase [Paludisphaera mucosa]
MMRRSPRPFLLLAAAFALAPPAAAQAPPPPTEAPAYTDHADLLVVRDARGAERPVESVADWEARRGHVLAHLQEVMGPLPGPERLAPLDWKVTAEFPEDGYVRKRIEYQAEPGDRVPAWLLIPDAPKEGPATKRPAMLCLHQTIAIGKDEPAGLGGKPDLAYARELARRGYVTLAPDYPNFGEYPRDVYKMGYASASMKAVWNGKRAVDLLSSLPQVDPERIGVIGHSLGGHNAIFTALFEPRLKVVVTSCGFTAFPYYYKGDVAGWSHKGYMPRLREKYGLDLNKIPFDFPELIGALAPRPFFTCSPLRDANFDSEGVRVCIRAARPIYGLYHAEDDLVAEYPDAEHSFEPETRMKAYEFLDRHLKPAH